MESAYHCGPVLEALWLFDVREICKACEFWFCLTVVTSIHGGAADREFSNSECQWEFSEGEIYHRSNTTAYAADRYIARLRLIRKGIYLSAPRLTPNIFLLFSQMQIGLLYVYLYSSGSMK